VLAADKTVNMSPPPLHGVVVQGSVLERFNLQLQGVVSLQLQGIVTLQEGAFSIWMKLHHLQL